MKLFLLMLVSIISVSGLAHNTHEDIVGSWSFIGPVCKGDGEFKKMFESSEEEAAEEEEEEEEQNLEIKSDGSIIFSAADCEIRTSYTYNGSTLNVDTENADTSRCPYTDEFTTDGWQNVLVKDDVLYLQYPPEMYLTMIWTQFMATQVNITKYLPEECTISTMYESYSRN